MADTATVHVRLMQTPLNGLIRCKSRMRMKKVLGSESDFRVRISKYFASPRKWSISVCVGTCTHTHA